MGLWNATGGGYKNYASATGLIATSDATAQNGSTNRALGVRQVTATDQGVAFAFRIRIRSPKPILQFLSNNSHWTSVGRTTTWVVDYGLGATPASFTPVTTAPALLTTGPVFTNTTVTASFGAALNNSAQPVWIRVVVLTSNYRSRQQAFQCRR